MKAIARLLDDEEWWVRLCAVGALSTFGRKARPLIPKILKCGDTDQKQLKDAIVPAVKNIEQSAETTEKEKLHRQRLEQITAFLERNRQQP